MKPLKTMILACVLAGLTGQALAQSMTTFHGFIDTYHAARTDAPHDYLSSRTRLRAELDGGTGGVRWFASANVEQNHVLPERTGFELREAYAEYAGRNWSLRAGRQIIIWGRADGVQVTDLISPQDLTEFLARDYDDIRTPVDALNFQLMSGAMTAELVWVPHFKPAVLPTQGTPWAMHSDAFDGVNATFAAAELPETELATSEFFARASFNFSGIDFAFSAMRTWSDTPVYDVERVTGTDDEYTITPRYDRLHVFGADLAKPVGDFVIRAETALTDGRRYRPVTLGDPLVEKRNLNSILGLDWYPGDSWTAIVQFNGRWVLNHDDDLAEDAHTGQVTLNVTKKLLREKLELRCMSYIGLDHQDGYVRASADYALADGFHLVVGSDAFFGDEGTYAQYTDNTEVWVKAKYSF